MESIEEVPKEENKASNVISKKVLTIKSRINAKRNNHRPAMIKTL